MFFVDVMWILGRLAVSRPSFFLFVGCLLLSTSCCGQDSYYFQPHPQDQDVRKGQSVTLECGVSNSKHVVFYWTLNGDALANTTRRFQVASNLHITRVDPSKDLGEFKCIATNVTTGISLASQGAQLNILCKYPAFYGICVTRFAC